MERSRVRTSSSRRITKSKTERGAIKTFAWRLVYYFQYRILTDRDRYIFHPRNGQKQWLPADNVIFGLIIFILGEFLFFSYLKRYLSWHYMMYSMVIVLILGLISLSSELLYENPFMQQMAKSIGISSFLFTAFVWIPYILVKKLLEKKELTLPTHRKGDRRCNFGRPFSFFITPLPSLYQEFLFSYYIHYSTYLLTFMDQYLK